MKIHQSTMKTIVTALQDQYGKETSLVIHQGKTHDYLGMEINYMTPGKVQFSMDQYIYLIAECPDTLMKSSSMTPTANHLFEINEDCPKLNPEDAILFHHAKLLYLCKRTQPDIQLAVSFLMTRVQLPDDDNFKKLG